MTLKRKVIIIILAIILGGVGYYLVSPLFFDTTVDETLTDILVEQGIKDGTMNLKTLKQGSWEGLAGHNAQGDARLIEVNGEHYIRFEKGFSVTNGPDLFVHLGKDGEYSKQARLGLLKGSVGAQNYKIPEEINIDDFNEVWVWCRAFSVPFAKVELKNSNNQ